MGRIYFRFIDSQIKEDRRLINTVRWFPVIYDTNNPSYTDKSERRKIWEQIAQNLQSSGQMCEERWNKLVEMYKFSNYRLHETLVEIMDEFLNVPNEPLENLDNIPDVFLKEQEGAVGFSAEEPQEEVKDNLYFKLMEDGFILSLPDEVKSRFTNFLDNEEEILEMYLHHPHSV